MSGQTVASDLHARHPKAVYIELAVHKVLARHGAYERCPDCEDLWRWFEERYGYGIDLPGGAS